MTRLALRGIAARKLRSVLTAMAIVMGVAMVTGAFVVSDTLVNGSDKLREAAYDKSDAVVAKKTEFTTDTVGGSDRTTIPPATLEKVRALPQVKSAVGDLTREGKLIGKDGKVIGQGPYFAVGLDSENIGAQSPFSLVDGRWATGPDEVVLLSGLAKDEGYKVGDKITFSATGPARDYRVVGTSKFGEVERLGVSMAILDMGHAQDVFNTHGRYDSILVDAREGVSQAELYTALNEATPGFTAQSASKQDRFTLDGLDEFLSFIKTFLVAFGAIAVFMGAFIIFNTLNITVAQRSRELGMLRTIGASRRQVLRSVVLEAFAIGLAASILGMALGYALGGGLMALLASAGIELPETGLVFAGHTVTTALIVGPGVTVLAGLVPAIRATRVSPIEALRDGSAIMRKQSRKAAWVAGAIALLSTGLVAYGLFGSGLDGADRLRLMGGGALLLFIGVAMLASRLVVPLASVLGRPAHRLGGSAGKLARRNAMREPGRTAATAAALMIGIALVTFVAVLSGGIKESVRGTIDKQVAAESVVASSDLWSPVPDKAVTAASEVEGVKTVSGVRASEGRSFGDTSTYVGAVDPGTIAEVYDYQWADGSSDAALAQLGKDGAIVRQSYAKDHSLKVGSRFELTSKTGEKLSLVVRGIESTPTVNPLNLGDVVLSDAGFDRAFDAPGNTYTWVKAEPGQAAAVQAGLEQALQAYPDVEAFSKARFTDEQIAFLDVLLGIIYVLLALSAIVSLFGIVNTLALSVFERTREVGMLRAVGMTRRQIRRMIRHESIITALIGAALGAALGILLGFLTVQALEEDGLKFVVPGGAVITVTIVAVIAVMIAAIGPARRAAKIEPVAALQYE